MNIFDFLYENFKFRRDQPIKLFEAFAGIGTQHMALKRLGVDVKLVGISEIDKYAIQSYEAIHGKVVNYGGVGDFDFPNNIDILTWSFPCQDISLAGRQQGMEDGTSSNYGYVFLEKIKKLDFEDRPQVLLMENVKALVSKTFEKDYILIHQKLEEMGYESFGEVLNAKDFNIPQNRERIFVISIKNNKGGQKYSYSFPKPVKLKNKLTNYYEEKVDDSNFLKKQTLETLLVERVGKFPRRKRFFSNINRDDYLIANTLTTRQGATVIDNYVKYRNGKIDLGYKATYDNLMNGELKLRKLTPLETWRLMGIKDEDFHKVKSSGISDSQLYKQAGNAIVVDVLVAIFKELIE